jgi:hypothetical protein
LFAHHAKETLRRHQIASKCSWTDRAHILSDLLKSPFGSDLHFEASTSAPMPTTTTIEIVLDVVVNFSRPVVAKILDVMTELLQVLLSRKCTVVSFPVHEYWIDIGQPDDYARTQRDFTEGKFSITS